MSVINANFKKRKIETSCIKTEKWISSFFYWASPMMFVDFLDKITVDDILEFCRFRTRIKETPEYTRQRDIVLNACGGNIYNDVFVAHDTFYDFSLLMIVVTDRFVTQDLLQIDKNPRFYNHSNNNIGMSTSSLKLVGKTGMLSKMYTYCSIERQGIVQTKGGKDSCKLIPDAIVGSAARINNDDLTSPWSVRSEMLDTINKNTHLKYTGVHKWPEYKINPMFFLIPKCRLSMISQFMHNLNKEKYRSQEIYKKLSSTVFSTDIGTFRHLFSNIQGKPNSGYTCISSQFIENREAVLSNRRARIVKSSSWKLCLTPMEFPWEGNIMKEELMNNVGVKRAVHEAVFGPMEVFCLHITSSLSRCYINTSRKHIADVLKTSKSLARQTFTEPWVDMGSHVINDRQIKTREDFVKLCIDTFPMQAK